VRKALLEDLLGLSNIVKRDLRHSLNNNHSRRTFLDVQFFLFLALGEHEVTEVVKVELHHVALQLDVIVSHFSYDIEQFDDRSGG